MITLQGHILSAPVRDHGEFTGDDGRTIPYDNVSFVVQSSSGLYAVKVRSRDLSEIDPKYYSPGSEAVFEVYSISGRQNNVTGVKCRLLNGNGK